MDSALAGPISPKAHYAPVNPNILDFASESISTSSNKKNIRPRGHDGQHMLRVPDTFEDFLKQNGSSGSKPWLTPGYKPFNPALLNDFEQPDTNTRMTESAWSIYTKAGSDDEQPADKSRMKESVWSTYANAGSTSSSESEPNPFRRARLNQSLRVPSTFDDEAVGLFRQANIFAATPKEQFAAALAIGDAVADTYPFLNGGRPKPLAEVDPDDYGFLTSSFGRRYTKNTQDNGFAVFDTPVDVENAGVEKRATENVAGENVGSQNGCDQECLICAETKLLHEFPQDSITAACSHPPASCLDCVKMSIKTDLDTKIWTEIRCPECTVALDYLDIHKYADEETFSCYEQLALRATMSQAENFVWCTAGCGSGQIHESDARHPIVTCLHCGQRSCFQHNVPWHEGLTCKEYDRLLADPENFKSRWENDDASEVYQRHQVDSDRAVARGLVAGDEAAQQRRQFKRRQREDRKKLEEAAARARELAIRKKRDEDRSAMTIGRTTKPCPGCGTPIEKKSGCSHIKCTKCKHEFCYECGASHKDILATDNSAHEKTCRFHSANLD